MKLFTVAFWKTAAENAIVTGLAAFAASGVFTTTPSTKGVVAAAVAAGMAALYTFVKQLGGAQAARAQAAALRPPA